MGGGARGSQRVIVSIPHKPVSAWRAHGFNPSSVGIPVRVRTRESVWQVVGLQNTEIVTTSSFPAKSPTVDISLGIFLAFAQRFGGGGEREQHLMHRGIGVRVDDTRAHVKVGRMPCYRIFFLYLPTIIISGSPAACVPCCVPGGWEGRRGRDRNVRGSQSTHIFTTSAQSLIYSPCET